MNMEFIKSPIRYPGAKSRAIPQIAPLIPDFEEYREPFIGGGSVYLHVRQKYGEEKKYWINDINPQLCNFWKQTQQVPDLMLKQIYDWKEQYEDGKQLLQFLRTNTHKFDSIQLGSAYYVNKRLSFSGFTRGFSEANFEKSFTKDKIAELKDVSNLLKDTRITNLDFQKVVDAPGNGVFIFLDPPYYNIKWDELYGTRGQNLHASFDHYRFADTMKKCRHKWLVTYDDSNTVRKLFDWATVIPWELTYTSRKVKTGQELFISNFLEKIQENKQIGIEDAWLR
jgi:DNA adenine methylase